MRNYAMCTNCGCKGHLLKSCMRPTTSCGIICVRDLGAGDPVILAVQRKDSFAFVEFMRGKYRMSDVEYVRTLFEGMTHSERKGVKFLEFSELWTELWNGFSKSKNKHEYENARCKFASLREGVQVNGRLCSIATLVDESVGRDSPEWGFPKGRRDSGGESDLECALREMREETGISGRQIKLNGKVYEETFRGTNGIMYRHVYFLAFLADQNAKFDNFDKEIKQAAWVSPGDLVALLGQNPIRTSIIRDVLAESVKKIESRTVIQTQFTNEHIEHIRYNSHNNNRKQPCP